MARSLESDSNISSSNDVFAAKGRCKVADEIRMRTKERGLKKNPGCSWTEVWNRILTFMARDKSYPECLQIHKKLYQITGKLKKEGGYVAQTKFVLHNVEENEKFMMLYGHSERLAIAYGLLITAEGTLVQVTKNLHVSGDCHTFCKLVSKLFGWEFVGRDANRFHHFENGVYSCGDFWRMLHPMIKSLTPKAYAPNFSVGSICMLFRNSYASSKKFDQPRRST